MVEVNGGIEEADDDSAVAQHPWVTPYSRARFVVNQELIVSEGSQFFEATSLQWVHHFLTNKTLAYAT
jgi:hypothetical protein